MSFCFLIGEICYLIYDYDVINKYFVKVCVCWFLIDSI